MWYTIEFPCSGRNGLVVANAGVQEILGNSGNFEIGLLPRKVLPFFRKMFH